MKNERKTSCAHRNTYCVCVTEEQIFKSIKKYFTNPRGELNVVTRITIFFEEVAVDADGYGAGRISHYNQCYNESEDV